MLIRRREMITGAGALAAYSALPDVAEAMGRRGGAGVAPVPPAPAQAWGLNLRTFYDDFHSTATIDLSNTKARGFNWYINNTMPNSVQSAWHAFNPTSSSSVAVSNSILHLSGYEGGAGDKGMGFCTVVDNGAGGLNGTAFAPPFYVECSMAFNPNAIGSSNPAFWMMATQMMSGSPFRYMELDIQEVGNGGVHEWTGETSQTNTNGGSYATGNLQVPNTYGLLVIPTALNAGTGLIRWYFNNTHAASLDVKYRLTGPMTPGMTGTDYNGALSETDTQTFPIIFGWDPTGSGIEVDWVKVWQASRSHRS